MKKLIYFFRDKWFKKTISTIILSALLICIFLLINIIVIKIDATPLDFTKEKRYSLSEESKRIAREVKQNVNMYFFGYEDDSEYVRLAKQYENENSKIKVQVVSFISNPDLATTFGVSVNDTIIAFQSNQRNKLLYETDLITYDLSTYEQIDISEQKFTNALIDVTITTKPQIYFLTGNEELTVDSNGLLNTMSLNIINEVNDVKSLDLLTTDLPDDCDVMVIANPTQDFTEIETAKILSYIRNGGNILWLQNPYIFLGNNVRSSDFPNVNRVLDEYGIRFSDSVVCESDSSYMLAGQPDCIMPILNYNDIVKDLYTDGKIVMTDAGKINFKSDEELQALNVSTDNFITTTDKAYYNTETTGALIKDANDEVGSFVLGSVLTKKIDDNTNSRLVAISSAYFVSDIELKLSNTLVKPVALRNNKDIITNTIAFLSNKDDSVRIRKNTNLVTFLQVSDKEDKVVRLIIFGLPLIIIVVGVLMIVIRNNEGKNKNK